MLLFGGGELFVAGSSALALLLGIPQIVIGLTVVSLGTSTPELFVSLISTFQDGDTIAVSNVVGSNLLNQLVILGVCGVFSGEGLLVDPVVISRDLPVMVLTTLALLPILWTRGVVTRLEGGILVGLYGLYLAEQVLSETLTTAQDEFRFVILVVVLPLVLVFFVWQMLRWRLQRPA